MAGTEMWSHLAGALVEHCLVVTLLPEWAPCSRSQNKARQWQECTHPPHREALCAPAPMANVSLLRSVFGVTSAWAVSLLISLGFFSSGFTLFSHGLSLRAAELPSVPGGGEERDQQPKLPSGGWAVGTGCLLSWWGGGPGPSVPFLSS